MSDHPPVKKLKGQPDFDGFQVDHLGRMRLSSSQTGKKTDLRSSEILKVEDGEYFVRIHSLGNASTSSKVTLAMDMNKFKASFMDNMKRIPWKE